MTMGSCTAFLIDADNLNDPEGVVEAFERLHALVGPTTVRRAYGSADSLKGLAAVLKQYAVRPCTNFVIEKNTTDLALAVDAMELACTSQPSVVALGSGDSDFYPLVVRLRELGVRVIAFSLNGKMSDDMRLACPEVYLVGQASAPQAVSSRKTAVKKVPVKVLTGKLIAAKKVATKKVAAKKVLSPAIPGSSKAAVPTVQEILGAVPGLREGAQMRLNEVAQQLHKAAVIGKSASSVKLFQKFRDDFVLTPGGQPTHVRWTQLAGG